MLGSERKSSRKRPPAVMFIIPLFFGLLGLSRVMQSAQFESYRTLDALQLVLSGACFGAALVGVMVRLLRPHT
jgi:hypothetical protein